MSLNPAPRLVAMVAAVAVVLAGLLPLAHLHADGEQPLVHRHLIGGDAGHHADDAVGHAGFDHRDSRFDHADHGDAQVLNLSYNHARPSAGIGCPDAVLRGLEAPPVAGTMPVNRRTLLPTHDPPLRFFSSPAPPAVV